MKKIIIGALTVSTLLNDYYGVSDAYLSVPTILGKNGIEKVLNILNKGSVFEKAKVLREKKHHIVRDNGDNLYFEFYFF